MKKVLTFLLCSLYFVSIPAISTEEPLTLSQNRRYALTQTVVDKEMYFDAIPERPTTKIEISSFQDEALTITGETLVPNTLLSIISLTINSNGIPVFTLSNGQFIKASREAIFNDLVSKQQSVSLDYWLKPSFVTYEAPYTNGVSEVKNNLKPYSRVHLVEQAETEHGIYYKTDSGFWISVEDLSVADNRMAKVQEVLLEKYNKDK
ncbi:TPA: serine hydrolase, partial [Streptococcus agalactiae]|nr:serine hydrolase [Streptococcus agalactiae]